MKRIKKQRIFAKKKLKNVKKFDEHVLKYWDLSRAARGVLEEGARTCIRCCQELQVPLLDEGPVAGGVPELKGSIGEGPNQTNYSDQSSVRILAKFRNFR